MTALVLTLALRRSLTVFFWLSVRRSSIQLAVRQPTAICAGRPGPEDKEVLVHIRAACRSSFIQTELTAPQSLAPKLNCLLSNQALHKGSQGV